MTTIVVALAVVDVILFGWIAQRVITTPKVGESEIRMCFEFICKQATTTPVVLLDEPVGGGGDDEIVFEVKAALIQESTTTPAFLPPVVCIRFSQYYHAGHRANDMVPTCGAYGIFASQEGTVIFAGMNGPYGNQIVIEHEGGWKTTYAHLKSFEVKEGDKVERLQLIGQMGSTGKSTGTHLHFEVINPSGTKLDPMKYVHYQRMGSRIFVSILNLYTTLRHYPVIARLRAMGEKIRLDERSKRKIKKALVKFMREFMGE